MWVNIWKRVSMDLTKGQQDIMEAGGHPLVTGGPGSGKTTISILKAAFALVRKSYSLASLALRYLVWSKR